LPHHALVCVGENQVSVPPEREGGVFANRAVAVGIPHPPHEAFVVGDFGSSLEIEIIDGMEEMLSGRDTGAIGCANKHCLPCFTVA
jgi:hypothetical protein